MIAILMVAIVLYILISLGMVVWIIRRAKRTGRSAIRWGLGAALILYMIPFWDWIPTVATHHYYCAKDSGLWVYKSLEEWKQENPGVLEMLVERKGAPITRLGDTKDYSDTYSLNQRISKITRRTGPLPINQWRWEQQVVDEETKEVLALSVDYSSGNGNIGGEPPIRFWLQRAGCSDSSAINDSRFHDFKNQFRGLR